MQGISRFKGIFIVILFFVIFSLVTAFVLRSVGLEDTQELVRRSGVWAPLVFVLLGMVSLILAPISGSTIFITGGLLFGKLNCFLLGYIASLLGCSSNFWISRKWGRKVAARLVGSKSLDGLDRFTQRLQNHQGIFYMILFLPIAQDLVSYAVGLTQIKYWQFFIALLVSSVFLMTLYIYLGSTLVESLIQSR